MSKDVLSDIQDDILSGNYKQAIEKIQTIPRHEYDTEQLLEKAILSLIDLEQSYHIIVFGDFSTGKTEFKLSVSNFFPTLGGIGIRFDDNEESCGFEVGCIKFDEFSSVCLWSPPNTTYWSQELFQPLIQTNHLLGCVALIDSKMTPGVRVTRQILDHVVRQNDRLFEEYLPYVIVANKQDHPDAWDMEDLRIVFQIRKDEKFLSCNAQDKKSVRHVLLELLHSVRDSIRD